MNYIFTMSLSGSCMYVLYKIFRRYAGNRLSEKWYYTLLRIAALYFMIPMPWLKAIYQDIMRSASLRGKYDSTLYYAKDQLVVYIGSNGWLLNDMARRQVLIVTVWLVGIILAGFLLFFYYLKRKKNLMNLHSSELAGIEALAAREILKEQGVRIPVQFRYCEKGISPFTIGVLRPVVFCTATEDAGSRELMLRHELIHIKRRDMLWRLFSVIIVVMHWYNPLAWLFRRDLGMVCESSCDEQVLKGQKERIRAKYAALLLSYAAVSQKDVFRVNLSRDGWEIQLRIKSFLNHRKKWPRVTGIVLAVILVLLNTTTVWAYKEVMVWHDKAAVLSDSWLQSEIAWVPSGEEPVWNIPGSQLEDVRCYDNQFMDRWGTVYQAEEKSTQIGVCSHYYIDGIQQQHRSLGEGYCEIIYRNALRCTKCGQMKEFSAKMVAIYDDCCKAE